MVMVEGIRPSHCRKPDIVADAAHAILTRPSRQCTGNFFIDEEVLLQEGIANLDDYAVDPDGRLIADLFVADHGGAQ
jgi:citronellol/citronellal dehydrogenase